MNSVEQRECSYPESNIHIYIVGWLLKVKFSFKAKLDFQSTVVFFLFFTSLNTHVYTNYSLTQLISFLCTISSLQFSLYSFLCTIFFVQFLCTVFSVQFPHFSFLCTVFSVQFPHYSFLCTVFSVQFSLYSFLCTVFTVQFSIFSLLCVVFFYISLYRFLSKVFFYTDFYLHFFVQFSGPWWIGNRDGLITLFYRRPGVILFLLGT